MNLRPFEMLLALVGYQILISAVFLRIHNEWIYPASSRIDRVDLASIILQENAGLLRPLRLEKIHEKPHSFNSAGSVYRTQKSSMHAISSPCCCKCFTMRNASSV